MKIKNVSIVVPAYNEEKRIGKMLEAYSDYFGKESLRGVVKCEILVVINNTTDKTEEVVKSFCKKDKRISFINLKRGGKGFAVREGFKKALEGKPDYIGFVDADLATPPSSFYTLIDNIGGREGVVASRYLKESKIYPSFTFRRLVVAGIFNFMVRSMFLFNLTDTQCGAKLFTRRAAKLIVKEVSMSQWAFDVELLYVLKKHNFKFSEVPTVWRDVESSKIRIVKSSFQMFLSLIQLRLINSPFKKLFKPLRPLIGILWRAIK